ncbi:MAG: hypothetical protein AAGI54_11020 [Planctomycetota bacterium]
MSDANPRSPVSLITLTLGLIFSVVFVVGPHVAIVAFVPNAQPWMLITYWLCMATYLAASYLVNVSPDTSNLGLGGTLLNNPFSYEDDHNRAMLKIALFLWPGKLVLWTGVRAYRVIRGV